MIHANSFTIEWIKEMSKINRKADPILIEKVIRAIYLLELLQNNGLNFIFKGGTSLMLMLSEPKRFSIDIDVIIENKADNLSTIFNKIIESSDFIEYKENERKSNSKIEKSHYKFYYSPVTSSLSGNEYILLDILFEKHHYGIHTQEIEISSPFIQTTESNLKVTIPIPEAILGDKLTAFAPNTTGIPYEKGKEIEIIKQLYDIGNLFDLIKKQEVVTEVFQQFAITELAYRNKNEHSVEDVLQDILQTSLLISTKGQSGIGNYTELQKGIQNIKNFIFSEIFQLEKAIVLASKSAYLSALIKYKSNDIHFFKNPLEIEDWIIETPQETKLNKLKKTNPEAFYYWYKACQLMKE